MLPHPVGLDAVCEHRQTPVISMPNSLPASRKILDVFETEQHHERSLYFFIRDKDIPPNR